MAKNENMEDKRYYYTAIVREVYDGDTCTVDIDLGLSTWLHGEKLRLNRIDTPELRGPSRERGLASRDFLREQIDGKSIIIETIKDSREKYGRYLAEIWLVDEKGMWQNINDLLVSSEHAIYRKY